MGAYHSLNKFRVSGTNSRQQNEVFDTAGLRRRPLTGHNCPMLGFFDESGDPGLKIDSGSSRFFVVALVTFADDAEALRCDRRIDQLRRELRLPAGYEFHFAKNPWKIREDFLRAAQAFDFRYHLFVLDKAAVIREGQPLQNPETLYQNTARLLFENAKPYLREVALLVDRGGDREIKARLFRRLRSNAGLAVGQRIIRGIKQQDSHRNNLLQLADYVASISNQAISGKGEAGQLQERYLRSKEVTRGSWPG